MTARDHGADYTRRRTKAKATDRQRDRERADRILLQRAGHSTTGSFFGWISGVMRKLFSGHVEGRGRFPSATKTGPGRRPAQSSARRRPGAR